MFTFDSAASFILFAETFVQALLAPLHFVFDPARRIYWLFLLSSLLLAVITLVYRHQSWSFKKICLAILKPSYWFNRSSATDVAWLSFNSVLRALILVPLFGSHLWATMIVARFWQTNLGNAPEMDWPLWLIMLLYTSVFFIVEDMSRFLLHYAMHKVPILWRFHRVHHSATVLTPLTVHRVHPVEMSLYFMRGMLVFGLISGSFVYLFGGKLSAWQILGVDALGFLFNLLGANLRHSHIWLSFGVFERWFISPAQHQIHHSSLPEHRDKNFGTCFAFWDRFFGSHVPVTSSRRYFRFGLRP